MLDAEAAGARYACNWMNATGGGVINSIRGAPGSGISALLQLATDEDEGIQSEEELVEKLGQKIELKFMAPAAGKHDLVLYVMPDSWVGVDRSIQLKIRTIEPTRAEREGRVVSGAGSRPAAAAEKAGGGKKKGGGAGGGVSASASGTNLDRSEESEAMMAQNGEEEEEAGEEIRSASAPVAGESSGSEDDEEDEEEEEEEGDREYDSDEYGTEETGSDDDNEDTIDEEE